jgi:ammonia channel protein AmtB
MGGGGRYLGAALVLVLALTAWVLGHMLPFFLGIKMLGLLRVDESEERMGLDISHHGGAAYEATAGEVLGKGGKEDDALLTRYGFQRGVMNCTL